MMILAMALALLVDEPAAANIQRGPEPGSVIRAAPSVDEMAGRLRDREGRTIVLRDGNVADQLRRDGLGRPHESVVNRGCKRVDTQYVELPGDTDLDSRAHAPSALARMPDADLIRTVLREVNGQCEIVVVQRNVSTPRVGSDRVSP